MPTGPPQNFTLSANNSRSLILSWDLPLPQDVNGVIVDYTINITSTLGTSSFPVQSSDTSYIITSLRPFIAYTCIIAAHTSVGRGPFSTGVTLTTPEDAPEAPPVTLSQNNLMSRSVNLTWDAPRSDRQNGIIRYYVIEAYENNTENTITYQTPSNMTNFVVNNLHPFYTYTIKIRAFTVGPGPLSLVHTVNTLEDSESRSHLLFTILNLILYVVPTGSPLNFTVVPTTSRSAEATWSPPSANEQNGVIIRYVINVTVVGTGHTFQLISTNTTLTVTNLTPYTTYNCIIAAETSAGTGPFSSQFTVSTPQDGE